MATVSNTDGTTVRASTYPDQLVASRLSVHEKGREFSSMSSFRDSLVDQGHRIVNAALCVVALHRLGRPNGYTRQSSNQRKIKCGVHEITATSIH